MMLLKTEKARQELMPGVRSLSLRERSLLLLADGKPLHELQAMYHGVGRQIVDDLVRAGYLRHPASRALSMRSMRPLSALSVLSSPASCGST